MKVKGKHVILSFVCLVLGFMISFSYQFTKDQLSNHKVTDQQWKQENVIRTQLNEQNEKNLVLQQELVEKQEKIRKIEEALANEEQEQIYYNLVEDVEKYRMVTGEIKVKGPGTTVTLEDASYVPSGQDVNNYLVHENHLFKVINELYISGAQAVSVNGKRLSHSSYIFCNGPVVTIDGSPYPAPFVISAIGDPNVLIPALNINGGIVDQLLQDNIVVKVENKAEITMEPLLGTNE
ncbi:DUF881 domain-containing protein [Ferdinandcohnia quinoae]|uniref:DUF881 domain-containing protein n=1 Tax=Fredinandcohnia quinoae TaxID=2918902 RepID=A0AAW5E1I6_9BACI|nr:DUF881 domain-containing protein [Fredinandcohnia sp. SECRCQ15]MCH1623871.1 DUF881 domain-containing protein [Fredinandcohnia sp. SECRCQ15]